MTVDTADPSSDRRAARSRALLLDALPSLMAERGFERLTTQNIIDRAGVGRATFYAHFENKDELLAASVARLRKWLEGARVLQPAQPFAFMQPFFAHVLSHRAIYRTTFERASEHSVQRHIRAMMGELVRAELVASHAPPRDEATIELATQFVVSAFWSVTAWWMGRGASLPPGEVNALFLRLAQPGLELVARG